MSEIHVQDPANPDHIIDAATGKCFVCGVTWGDVATGKAGPCKPDDLPPIICYGYRRREGSLSPADARAPLSPRQPIEVETEFPLEPVGVDWDGEVKPIAALDLIDHRKRSMEHTRPIGEPDKEYREYVRQLEADIVSEVVRGYFPDVESSPKLTPEGSLAAGESKPGFVEYLIPLPDGSFERYELPARHRFSESDLAACVAAAQFRDLLRARIAALTGFLPDASPTGHTPPHDRNPHAGI